MNSEAMLWVMALPGNGDGTREHAVLFQEQKIGRARPEIDDHGAALEVAVIVTDRVVERHRGDIHDVRPQSAGFHAFGEFFDDVTLDGQEHDLQFPLRVAAEQLIIPNDFIDGEGDVLLGLILDDLRDLGLIDGRQFDEPGEHGLAGNAEHDTPGLDVSLADHIANGGHDERLAVFFVFGIDPEFGVVEIRQAQSLALGGLKFAYLDSGSADVQRQHSLRA